ncbi:unnamed protein product [Rotaria magnacalcarata]
MVATPTSYWWIKKPRTAFIQSRINTLDARYNDGIINSSDLLLIIPFEEHTIREILYPPRPNWNLIAPASRYYE